MEFRVLGMVSVVSERGEPLPLGPAKRCSLLAMLLLRPNAEVAVDRLTEALWDEEPPRHSRTVVQGHVSRLRTLLDEHRAAAHGVELATRSGAYILRLSDPGTLVDARRFEELLRLARTRHEPGEAVALLREALGLWQGPAFAGTVGSRALEAAAHELEELRLVAVEELAGAHGRLGEHGTAAAVLRAEAVAHPLREPLIAALMLALGRAGRQSEALDWFHRTRLLLADQLGVDPGAVLTDAYTALLRADLPQDDAPTAAAVLTAPTTVSAVDVPQLLPRRPGGFTGRQPELAALDRATVGAPGPIALITGSAGVGKTALALHWAHRHGADFPGGRLFADLRGYSSTPARDTTLVLRGFLLALGVPAEAMPETPEAMGARYRALTAGRRMLVVLDNARASEHIRPLLPGGEDCVTSRDRLGGLVASDAARPVPLAELPAAQSTALLAAVRGRRCGHRPRPHRPASARPGPPVVPTARPAHRPHPQHAHGRHSRRLRSRPGRHRTGSARSHPPGHRIGPALLRGARPRTPLRPQPGLRARPGRAAAPPRSLTAHPSCRVWPALADRC